MPYTLITMIILALVTGFALGWVAGVDTLKQRLTKMSLAGLSRWASSAREKEGLR